MTDNMHDSNGHDETEDRVRGDGAAAIGILIVTILFIIMIVIAVV